MGSKPIVETISSERGVIASKPAGFSSLQQWVTVSIHPYIDQAGQQNFIYLKLIS